MLNLLPTSTTDATAVSSSPVKETKNNSRKEVPSPISNISQEEMQKLRKLVRIYCPFNFNHATKVNHSCRLSVYTANLCNQSVTEGQQIDAILANFLLLQLLFAIFADFWLQSKSASFKCKNYIYYLLHLKAALLREN